MRTSSPAHTDVVTRLRLAIARTARRMRQEAGGGLSPSQAAALATIDRCGPISPSDLAARERVQRPTVTRLVARMEEDGLVTRTPDPRDGRSSLISISDDGHALLESVRSRKDAFLARRLEDLDARERATLEQAVEILERMLDE